jgi:hypothetical protein
VPSRMPGHQKAQCKSAHPFEWDKTPHVMQRYIHLSHGNWSCSKVGLKVLSHAMHFKWP